MNSCIAASEAIAPAKPAWRAVYSLGLGVFGLITAEFLPASLLTPMAASLGVTEGMAGQAVTATALVALVTGLLITTATRNIDRRWVLMFFSVLQIISSLMVAFAPSSGGYNVSEAEDGQAALLVVPLDAAAMEANGPDIVEDLRGAADGLDRLAALAQHDALVARAADIDDLVDAGRAVLALLPALGLDGELIGDFLVQPQGQLLAGHLGGDLAHRQVGDLVLAIGNPFGVGQTVTNGIISALNRTETGISDSGSFIQTDAAINPGNSGGALVDMDGDLIGINTAIFSRTGSSSGVGFAVGLAVAQLLLKLRLW